MQHILLVIYKHMSHTYTQSPAHTHTNIHTVTYAHVHTYIHTVTCTHTYKHTHSHIHTVTYTHVHTYIHTYTHTHTYTYTQSHTHTYTHTSSGHTHTQCVHSHRSTGHTYYGNADVCKDSLPTKHPLTNFPDHINTHGLLILPWRPVMMPTAESHSTIEPVVRIPIRLGTDGPKRIWYTAFL